MSGSAVTAKDAALRAVGRSVVNFQRLEHNLKVAARLGPLDGVLAKVQRDFERRTEKASSFTLGQSIEAWLTAMKGGGPLVNPTPDLFEPTVRLTVSLEMDSESFKAHAETLKNLLDLRNRLIHGGLVNFDWDSQDDCDRLVGKLAEVNEVIGSQIDFVAAVVRSFGPGGAVRKDSTGEGEGILVARLGSDS